MKLARTLLRIEMLRQIMRITVVEDNIALAQGIAHSLRDAGHAVDHLSDGAEAAVFLEREGSDLVVLDINLPGRNGLEAAVNADKRGPDTSACPDGTLRYRGQGGRAGCGSG
jgi:CheY-like chemotaxis protein